MDIYTQEAKKEHKNFIYILIFVITQSIFSQKTEIKVVFDVTSKNVKTHQMTVRHVELMSNSYPDSQFEVVLYGGSIEMALNEKSTVKNAIQLLSKKDNVVCKRPINIAINKKILTIFILFNPVVHKINNSCCLSNFKIEIVKDNKKASGINRVIIVVIFNTAYLK